MYWIIEQEKTIIIITQINLIEKVEIKMFCKVCVVNFFLYNFLVLVADAWKLKFSIRFAFLSTFVY